MDIMYRGYLLKSDRLGTRVEIWHGSDHVSTIETASWGVALSQARDQIDEYHRAP